MTVIIETPRGSKQKFKYDPATRTFFVNKTLPAGMTFPFEFGYIPNTRGEDGDPIDILILAGSPHATGTQLDARIIGCLPATQTDGDTKLRNDRFVGVPADNYDYPTVQTIAQLPEELVESIKSFFITYLSAEGKTVNFLPTMDNRQAEQLLQLARS